MLKKYKDLDSEKISIDYQTLKKHLQLPFRELLKVFKEGSLFFSFLITGIALYFLYIFILLVVVSLPSVSSNSQHRLDFVTIPSILMFILCFTPTIIWFIHFCSDENKKFRDMVTKLCKKNFEILEDNGFKLISTENGFCGWKNNIYIEFIAALKKRFSLSPVREIINFISPCNYQGNTCITIKRNIFLYNITVLSNDVPLGLKPIFEEFLEKTGLRKIKKVYYGKIHLWDLYEEPFFKSINLSFGNGFCYSKYESICPAFETVLERKAEKVERTVRNVIESYETTLEKIKIEFGPSPAIKYNPEEIMLKFTNQIRNI